MEIDEDSSGMCGRTLGTVLGTVKKHHNQNPQFNHLSGEIPSTFGQLTKLVNL